MLYTCPRVTLDGHDSALTILIERFVLLKGFECIAMVEPSCRAQREGDMLFSVLDGDEIYSVKPPNTYLRKAVVYDFLEDAFVDYNEDTKTHAVASLYELSLRTVKKLQLPEAMTPGSLPKAILTKLETGVNGYCTESDECTSTPLFDHGVVLYIVIRIYEKPFLSEVLFCSVKCVRSWLRGRGGPASHTFPRVLKAHVEHAV